MNQPKNVQHHDVIDSREVDFRLDFDLLSEGQVAPEVRAAQNADMLQVEAPPAHVRDRRVRLTAAGKRAEEPDGVVVTSAYLSPKAARELAARLTEAADALEAEKPYASATLIGWKKIVRVQPGTA